MATLTLIASSNYLECRAKNPWENSRVLSYPLPVVPSIPPHAAGGDFRSSLEKQGLRRKALRLSIFCHDWSLSRSFAPLRGAAAKPGYAWDKRVTQKVNSQNHSFSDPEAEELKTKADHKPVVWPDVHEHSFAKVL